MIEVQELIGCEGALRDDFECIMSQHHYALERNQHGEAQAKAQAILRA